MARRRSWPRLFSVLLLLLLVIGAVMPVAALAQGEEQSAGQPEIGAVEAIVVEYPSGRILYQKAAHDRMPPASLTKILTAILAIEYGKLDDVVTVDPADLAGESTMGLVAGEQQKLHDLLYGMLLPSGNDAATAIARHLGSMVGGQKNADVDPLARFADMMNARVAQLGLTDSHFVTPHGLDTPDHYSSAYDLASLAWYALHLPVFNEIVRTVQYDAPGHSLLNTNEMLTRYMGADGIKTGWTDGCGLCLVTSATRNGHRLISVVLNAPQWYGDSATILDYGFAQLQATPADPNAEVLSVSKRDAVAWMLANPASSPPLALAPPMAQGGGAAAEPLGVSAPAVGPDDGKSISASSPSAPSVVASGKSIPAEITGILIFAVVAAVCMLLMSRLWRITPTKALGWGIGLLGRKEPSSSEAAGESSTHGRPPRVQARTWGGRAAVAPEPKVLPLAVATARRREPNLLAGTAGDRLLHIERAIALSEEGKQGSGMSEFTMALRMGGDIDVSELAEQYRLSASAFLALARAQVSVGQAENARRTLLHGVLVLPNERVLKLALYQLQPASHAE